MRLLPKGYPKCTRRTGINLIEERIFGFDEGALREVLIKFLKFGNLKFKILIQRRAKNQGKVTFGDFLISKVCKVY